VLETVKKYVEDHIVKQKVNDSEGILIESVEFDGMDSEEAKIAIVKKVGGRMTSTYRLRDWSVGRQRYWGVPIPIVYDPEGKAHVVPKEHLPWALPEDVDFTPTGEPPLAKSAELKKRTEEIFGQGWTPEVETMDTFVDSSWYFLRYLDNKNDSSLSSLERQNEWMPIDIYFGGAEHTTMHLLYSRFWNKALYDLGLVEYTEPYKRRINRGLILGPDGNKMSKSKGNGIDPDEQVARVGADTVKMYLAFMGPYEGANYPFDLGGIAGIRRFLERVYGLSQHITANEDEKTIKLLHKTIKKVQEDVENYKFNTAISAMMVFVNHVEKNSLSKDSYVTFLRLLAPFAPHLTEELWSELGNTNSIHLAEYPKFDETLVVDETVTIGVQINGKLRGDITITPNANEEEVRKIVENNADLQKYLANIEIIKFIYVPGRIVNVVVK
jgi:leucyl-tRNA synthetase